MKTAKEVFETIYAAMAAQNWQRAEGPGGGCVYLTETGRKCAVGCLIPTPEDPVTRQDLQEAGGFVTGLRVDDGTWTTNSPSMQAVADGLNAAGIPATAEMRHLLGCCQNAHDRRFDPDIPMQDRLEACRPKEAP